VTDRCWLKTMSPALTTSSMTCLLMSRSSAERPWPIGAASSAELRSSSSSCLRTSSFMVRHPKHEAWATDDCFGCWNDRQTHREFDAPNVSILTGPNFPVFRFPEIPSSMPPIARAEVLSVYRHLLRSIAIAFNGDQHTLSAARQEARRRFKEQQCLDPESAKAMEALTEAKSVGRFLRQNLVQGVKAEGEERFRKALAYL